MKWNDPKCYSERMQIVSKVDTIIEQNWWPYCVNLQFCVNLLILFFGFFFYQNESWFMIELFIIILKCSYFVSAAYIYIYIYTLRSEGAWWQPVSRWCNNRTNNHRRNASNCQTPLTLHLRCSNNTLYYRYSLLFIYDYSKQYISGTAENFVKFYQRSEWCIVEATLREQISILYRHINVQKSTSKVTLKVRRN